MEKILIIILLLTIFTFLILINQCLANGVLLDGLGPIPTGRGSTNIAHNDNGNLIHDNPSALSTIPGKRIEMCNNFITLPMNYRDPDNNKDGKESIFFLPSFSYVQKHNRHPFGMGIGLYNPAGFSTEYHLVHPIYGNQRYSSNASLTKILFGVGWKMRERFSFGISIGPAYSKIEFKEPYTFQTGSLQGALSLIDMEGDDWALAWNMGAQWHISSNTTLALAYINSTIFHINGNASIENPVDPNGDILPLIANYKVQCDFKWPQTLGMGMTHLFNTNHRISIDMVWIDWSSAFNELILRLSNGNNLSLPSSTQDNFPLHWKESYSFRLGYEYYLTLADTLRFGYVHNQNPVPDSTLFPLIPGNQIQSICSGYTHHWKNCIINISYVYSFGPRQSVSTSRIIGGDYNDSSLKVRSHFFSLGFQYKF